MTVPSMLYLKDWPANDAMAETSRATSELEGLNTRQLGLEKSMENIDGLDFSLTMTRYTTTQVETQFRAQLVSKAEDLHVRIADLLE